MAQTDSYRKFLGGVYRMLKEPYYRKMGITEFGNEFCSAFCGQITGYAPKNQGYVAVKVELVSNPES
ncbi:hypothetical protein [Geomonas ferrireducens]|uniref:hypothetical protein n=1 Tax=Geomonas ferrireducens TaxID=2570227 RepID=UPI0010A8A57A|nr:hypothetical protein [Geomonas ferrireducens]